MLMQYILLSLWKHLGVKLQQETLMTRIIWSSLTFVLSIYLGATVSRHTKNVGASVRVWLMTSVCRTDIPKFLTNHTIFYSWEGNPVNISCDVMSNPPATMLWRRERFTISAEGTANIRVHAAEGKSVLEVGPHK